MCCVMPPASPLATRARRMLSSSEVLPWSTWPITVTTGGRGSSTAVDVPSSSLSASSASGSSSLAARALWPISSTTIIAVSWSSTWLMVTIVPIFIIVLITSTALTAILWARSATLIVSGTVTSRTIGPLAPVAPSAPSSSCRRVPILGCLQPPVPAPPVTSPRSLSARRRAASSWKAVPVFFSGLGFSPGLAAGRCSVPVGALAAGAGAGAIFAASRAAASAATFAAASSASRSFFDLRRAASACLRCRSSSCRCRSSCALRSSAARVAISSGESREDSGSGVGTGATTGSGAAASTASGSGSGATGATGGAGVSATTGCGGGAATTSGSGAASTTGTAGSTGGASSKGTPAASDSSRLTNTRFLRTSTWMVRAFPVVPAARISVVCLRVSVILRFASPAAPCCFCRYSRSRVLSASERSSPSCLPATPALSSCSSRALACILSSVANCSIVVCAIYFSHIRGVPRPQVC